MKDNLTETLKACLKSAKSIEDLAEKLISEGVTLQHCPENVQSDSLKNDLLKSEFWRLNEKSGLFELDRDKTARNLQRMGYRKASEIFEEIEKRLAMYSHIHRYAEEANKVTEEYADGSPVEMTSVWDACRLEHNGYDDYETMCKLQDNIGNIEKSRLLKEFEVDIAQLKKKYTEERK